MSLKLTQAQLRAVEIALVLRLKINGQRGDGTAGRFSRIEERATESALRLVRVQIADCERRAERNSRIGGEK